MSSVEQLAVVLGNHLLDCMLQLLEKPSETSFFQLCPRECGARHSYNMLELPGRYMTLGVVSLLFGCLVRFNCTPCDLNFEGLGPDHEPLHVMLWMYRKFELLFSPGKCRNASGSLPWALGYCAIPLPEETVVPLTYSDAIAPELVSAQPK